MNGSVAAFRAELRSAAKRRARIHRRRRRAALASLITLFAVACTGITLAANGVFAASPAPGEVVEDFGAYATQLGYHPRSHHAQLVAVDGEFRLYATPNREGTYCIVTSAPWRPPGRHTGDGGVCVPPKKAAEPIAVGITAASGDPDQIMVVAGRVLDSDARRLRFADATGDDIERPLGAGGFFVVGVHQPPCTGTSWSPIFTATDAQGNPVATARITLTYVDPHHGERGNPCGGFEGTPHGPYPFDEQPQG
jgi:hypothetical protein